jgi:thiol-disulfide isomerase/thioredoxin
MRLAIVMLVALAAPAQAQVLRVNDTLAELDVAVDRGGKPQKLAAYRGRWIVITIGARWCEPCKKELPVWDQLAGELKGRITFIALDIDDNIADGKAFHDGLGLAHMVRVYLPQDRSAVAGRYGADTMPTTFVADPRGVIRYVHAKFDSRDPAGEYAKLKTKLEQLVPPPKPRTPKPPAPKPAPKPAPSPDPKPAPKSPAATLPVPVPPLVLCACEPGGLWSEAWRDRLRF